MLIAFLIMDFHYLEMKSVVRARMQALTTAPRMQALTTAPRSFPPGMVSVVRARKQGFAHRYTFERFTARYAYLIKGREAPDAVCTPAYLEHLKVATPPAGGACPSACKCSPRRPTPLPHRWRLHRQGSVAIA